MYHQQQILLPSEYDPSHPFSPSPPPCFWWYLYSYILSNFPYHKLSKLRALQMMYPELLLVHLLYALKHERLYESLKIIYQIAKQGLTLNFCFRFIRYMYIFIIHSTLQQLLTLYPTPTERSYYRSVLKCVYTWYFPLSFEYTELNFQLSLNI
jgi:hypothetical protein